MAGVVDGLIVLHGAAVGTPLDVHADAGLLVLAGLGSDKDDTRRAARTIQGGGSGVLQHRDGGDVALRDVAQRGGIRRTVHDDERLRAQRQRRDASDVDAGIARTRSTRTATHLEARRGAHQGVGHVGGDVFLQILAVQHGGRTGEGALLLRAEGHDHDLIQQLGVRHQLHLDQSPADVHLLRQHADIRDAQALGVGRHVGDGKLAVDVGYRTHLGADYQNRRSHNRLACLFGSDDTRHHRSLSRHQTYTHTEEGPEKH